MKADAIVVGGGLHGCSAAFQLARRGLSVVVLERWQVARHASGASAGGVRTMGRDIAEIPLSLASDEMWQGIADLLDDDCGYHAHGQIKVGESEAEMAGLARRVAETRALGFTHEEMIDQAELRSLVPAIAPHALGGMTVRSDGAADPYRTTAAFRRKAEELGARIVEHAEVTGLRRADGMWTVSTPDGDHQASAVVNCAGAWAHRIAAMAGDVVPLSTRCSMMIVTERLPHFLDPVIGGTGRKLSFKQTPQGTVLIGGGQQARPNLDAGTYEVDPVNMAKSAEAATGLFPAMQGVRVVRVWAGLEAQTPDHIPVIGPSAHAESLFHAFGFSGHGFQLGPVVGSAMADLVTTGGTNLPIAPFGVDRFARAAAA